MIITWKMIAIVCPMAFLAGLVDAIGGGGGLISLPAYIFAGVPTHLAVATNKLAASCGTTLVTAQFLRRKLVNMKIGVITILCAIVGSSLGANLSLRTDEHILRIVLIPVLIVAAFFVLNRKIFGRSGSDEVHFDLRTVVTAGTAAFIVGIYDGFYGPGTGTFLIIALNVFAGIGVARANAQAKVINLTSNVTALVVFILNGQVIWLLGLLAALFNMAGAFLGGRLALTNGEKITRPVILIVLVLLFLKIISG